MLIARRHRVLKGIGAAIGTLLGYGIISGLIGFVVAIFEAKNVAALASENVGDEMVPEIVNHILSRLLNTLTGITIVCLTVTVILIYRRVRRMQY